MYTDARAIGEKFREGYIVTADLSAMNDSDAKRLVDFMAGMVFVARGSITRMRFKVFELRGPGDMTAEATAASEPFLYAVPNL